MDEGPPAPPGLIEELFAMGPLPLLVVLAIVGVTLWLAVSRVRRCFRSADVPIVRDLAMFFAPPLAAVLLSLVLAANGTIAYAEGGIDTYYAALYALKNVGMICEIALLCFLISLVAMVLPAKRLSAALPPVS
jgi:hypothetical protein